jgi:hypothetical protein
MANVVSLNLVEIIRCDDLQTRPIDAGTVHRYAQAYKANAPLPPITVVQIEKGPPMLLDGWHRVSALERIGAHRVDADVLEASDVAAARWLAMKANLTHGFPLKPAQRREAFRAFMRAGQWRKGARSAKSLRDIARELGASHNTIRAWMQKDFKAISRDWYRGDGDSARSHSRGGLREQPSKTMRDIAVESAEAASRAFRGIKEINERSEVIAKFERLLDTMKGAGSWKPWKPEEF